MAISFRPQPEPCKPNPPLMDASNRTPPTKRHAHFRSLSASTLRKSPPTCTLSLASVTTGPAIAISLSIPSTPSEASCGIPFPSEADVATAESSAVTPDPWRRPRARTSHVVTQRRTQQPSKSRRVSCRSARNTTVTACGAPSPALHLDTTSPLPPSPQRKTPTPSELRLTALVERSIAHHIATRSSPSSSSSTCTIQQLDEQDALLLTHLRAFLASHGKPPSPSSSSSPAGIAIAIAPPTCAPSLLLCGSSGLDSLPPAPASSPPPTASPLRFIPGNTTTTTTSRARSGSRSTTITLTLPALVATLVFRRHEPGRACSPSSFVSRREARRAMPRRSGLGGRCILAEDDDSMGR
ncbi:hypothetical protein R3P38DRAFT_616019 [Favolaschia claudopus]|uniref:Uncharacterized protein n=1 Tax=Favolaschia claudopus TaxID=2862362 RepID=A0AAW0CC11_9AGAR